MTSDHLGKTILTLTVFTLTGIKGVSIPTGSVIPPSLSHLINGGGLPLAEQVSVIGLHSTASSTS